MVDEAASDGDVGRVVAIGLQKRLDGARIMLPVAVDLDAEIKTRRAAYLMPVCTAPPMPRFCARRATGERQLATADVASDEPSSTTRVW